MIDRYTKAVLTIIAAALWLNLASGILRPTDASAQSPEHLSILRGMAGHLSAIYMGICTNHKICGP